jgi:hypothetical protein
MATVIILRIFLFLRMVNGGCKNFTTGHDAKITLRNAPFVLFI